MASAHIPKARKGLSDERSRCDAIGIRLENGKYVDAISNKRLSASENITFFIPDESVFVPLLQPEEGDWLAEQKERGQTYKKYISGIFAPRCPSRSESTLYILPTIFQEEPIPTNILEPLVRYAAIFFGMPVKLLPGKCLKGEVADRLNHGVYQVHAGEILNVIKNLVPRDAFGVAAITLCDLYPRDDWNFVFALALPGGRCGVFSLARYLSSFGDSKHSHIDLKVDSIPTVLERACKTMCHETCCMFAIQNCIFYSCLMNGSNHLEESDSTPNFLCPVCLRKLHYGCKFDIVARYQGMKTFWKEHAIQKNVDWIERRLRTLSNTS